MDSDYVMQVTPDEIRRAVTTRTIPRDARDRTDAIKRLEAWKAGHKSRSCSIGIDDGYGATCWKAMLRSRGRDVEVAEIDIMGSGAAWPGLAAVIHAAIDKAEKLGL